MTAMVLATAGPVGGGSFANIASTVPRIIGSPPGKSKVAGLGIGRVRGAFARVRGSTASWAMARSSGSTVGGQATSWRAAQPSSMGGPV